MEGESTEKDEALTTETSAGKSQTAPDRQISAAPGGGIVSEKEPSEQEKAEVLDSKTTEESIKKIPDDFFYDYEEICSRPSVTADSGIPSNLLQLMHSFGYDCTKRANLQLMDEQTVMYIAGNLILILNMKTKEQRCLRSCSGGGIGMIKVHSSYQYFAVAEKGINPHVIIYEYPSLRPFRILRGGTVEAYAYVDFNVSGTLLASVGSSPDYMLTVWNWKEEQIVLRSKAFSQDVFRVTFSTENEDQLTTSGTGHIKFWKMARTFTGLKLQGALGRFGKTALTDIEGYVELPDGKVVSGSEWGNMLLWEGGLIKVEVCRKGKRSCHIGSINQFVLDEGELITIGTDGYVRAWDFETLDAVESVDETGVVEMEPMNELLVGKNVNLFSMVKSHERYSPIWYAQDASGGIWKLDLSFSNITQDPECLFSFHSGKIKGLDTSPNTYLLATTALDRSVRIYDFIAKHPVVEMRFKQGGTSLVWVPSLINPKGGLIAVGFEDGVVRILQLYNPKGLAIVAGRNTTGDAEMCLKQAFKPHNAAVTAFAYERNGELLATGSEDETVFFFATGDKYEPIGFIRVPGPVRELHWSPPSHEQNMLLVLCENGFAVQVPAPSTKAQYPESTFEIHDLPTQYFHFYSIKSRIKRYREIETREEERVRREKIKEQKQKEKEAWIQKQKQIGVELTEEDLLEEPEEEEELPAIYIPEKPSPILCGFYSTPGNFWLSLGGYDSGFLYHCKFPEEQNDQNDFSLRKDEPFDVVPMEYTDNNSIEKIHFSSNKNLMFCGMEDGAVRVYPLLNNDPLLSSIQGYWTLNVHDNDYGCIQALTSSYEGQFLITCGADGNIFTFSILLQEDIEKEMKGRKAKVPSPRKELDMEKAAEDIEDPKAYSIENAKLKREHDQMVKEAEDRKSRKRQELDVLRTEFRQLLMKNRELPTHMQLQRAEFEMDHRIREEMERQTSHRVRTVYKEMAWEQEKHKIGLQKLQARFRDTVEFDTVVVHAIQSDHQVATYRLLALSDKYHRLMKKLKKRRPTRHELKLKEVEAVKEIREAAGEASKRKEEMEQEMPEERTDQWAGTHITANRAEKLKKIIEKAEKAKAKIANRKKEWEELYNKKPSENYEHPEDVMAIKEAKDKIGDFRLKTAADYTVPEHLRINAEKKRGHLAVLEGQIHRQKENMNRKIIALRDFKVSTIEEIKRLVQAVKKIQSTLDLSKHLPIPQIPQMLPEEMPEKKFQYDNEILLKFKLEQEHKLKTQDLSEKHGGFGGFAGFSGHSLAQKQSDRRSRVSLRSWSDRRESSRRSYADEFLQIEEETKMSTELEAEIRKIEEIKNMYMQECFINKINSLISTFDAELRLLRHERQKMDLQMKMGDLMHITLFDELLHLKDFEKREDILQERVTDRIAEKEEMKWKCEDYQQQLEIKKRDIAKLQEREKALCANFNSSLGENNKFANFLTKVFKKKIKRTKKKEVVGEEDEEEESDEESEDESAWDSDEDTGSESDVFDDSVCPENCDPVLFDNTLQLREKRLDIEEALAEEKKVADYYKKEYDGLLRKIKVVESNLMTAEAELEVFQREKQQKLNELYVVVPLKLHQVEYVVNNEIPTEFSQALVFTNHALHGLQYRIKELQLEKVEQRELYKQARQQHKQLIRDRKDIEARIEALEEKCRQEMMLKFGRLVDLEVLQTLSVNTTLEELKEKTLENEMRLAHEIKKWEDKIVEVKRHLMEVTKEHTIKLTQMDTLLLRKKGLEIKLDERQTNPGEEFRVVRKSDIQDRERLMQLVTFQIQEIDVLKEEINLLSRKGGNILPPAQGPVPQNLDNLL
ncbi:cilia- and flagella-associated protein 44 [Microcaecilia unicolor]|uniref:Cilia- and flagella-associated protein 44 n=1 Tax=Microcaecilia unicolor TaxID=1415580 RepID=A0A6P7XWF0_9AMPH|nr:cilia- and flagella-associated protein 44 [Microcaecilia unicolor]